MQHSVVDLEIHAKTVQENLHRDAERARLVAAAESRGLTRSIRPAGLLHRLVASALAWLVGTRIPQREPGATRAAADHPASATPRPVPARAAEPYAAMVVIARASALPIAEQPSRVGDC
jgi:hypothetical protein